MTQYTDFADSAEFTEHIYYALMKYTFVNVRILYSRIQPQQLNSR